MRKYRLKRNAIDDEATVNLTPLIDVVFVVLIMFIIVAPLLEIDKIDLAHAASHPNKEISAVQDTSSLKIHVHEDNSIWINSKKVAWDEFTSILKMAKRQNPKQIPQLFHDKKAFFGTYQTIKNEVQQAGFEELDVILKPK